MLAFCGSPRLSTWARMEGEGSSCCYFLGCHFFPRFSKEDTENLSNFFMPKPSSRCITSNRNVFCLMIKSNQNPLASIQPHCFCLMAVCLRPRQQLAICRDSAVRVAASVKPERLSLGRKMTGSAQQLAKLEKRFLVKYVKNNSSRSMTWGEKWETSLRQMAIPC